MRRSHVFPGGLWACSDSRVPLYTVGVSRVSQCHRRQFCCPEPKEHPLLQPRVVDLVGPTFCIRAGVGGIRLRAFPGRRGHGPIRGYGPCRRVPGAGGPPVFFSRFDGRRRLRSGRAHSSEELLPKPAHRAPQGHSTRDDADCLSEQRRQKKAGKKDPATAGRQGHHTRP